MTTEPEALAAVAVTQADCDAAADYLESMSERAMALRARHPATPQGGPLSQAFARHRIAALSTPAARMLAGEGKLVETARRNIRSFLKRVSFKSENDRQAALACVDVLEDALAHRPAAEPINDASLKSMVGELGNQIHNLGCERQGDEALASRLEELRSEAWRIARLAPATIPAAEPVGLREELEQFKHFDGPLPDYDSPLRCVYESGIQYAVNLLAQTLDVKDWDVCDGTEEFDGDLSGTMFNIVLAAMPKDADGDYMHPRDVCAALATPARTDDAGGARPYPKLLTADERKTLLKKAEELWSDLEANYLGGFSGINRPFYILHQFKTVIEDFGNRDVGLSWSKDQLDAASAANGYKGQ